MKQVTIITDYRGFLYSSVKNVDVGIDLKVFVEKLNLLSVEAEVIYYRDVNINDNWKDKVIVYQSSEDRGLYYKDYIEDVLLVLEAAGAKILPNFHAFRAHHNKAFQELYRPIILPESFISSKVYGCIEDLVEQVNSIEFPCVLKASQGAKSKTVSLCKNRNELIAKSKKLSACFNFTEWSKDLIKSFIRPYHVRVSQHKVKFIVQKFIPGLTGDFKVLIYGNKCVAIERGVKEGDFRASGSGLMKIDQEIPMQVISYAFELAKRFDVPYGSFDVALNNGEPELIEYQFVTFGTSTLFLSNRYYELKNAQITEIQGKLDLEQTIAEALVFYVGEKGGC